jgi:hypothetical protein
MHTHVAASLTAWNACACSWHRFNIFSKCPAAKTCTFVLRGGADQFIEEVERSLHDAIMIVRRAIKNQAVVAGGGATELELSRSAPCLRAACRWPERQDRLMHQWR